MSDDNSSNNSTATTTTGPGFDPPSGPGQRAILVHKENEEGALSVDAFNGRILTSNDERPEWAEGLATAVIGERHGFYLSRVGPERFTFDQRFPEMLAFEDLTWIGVNAEGEEVEIAADDEFRMNAIATILGESREDSAYDDTTLQSLGTAGGYRVVAEREIAMDQERSEEEVGAFVEAKDRGFQEERRTATGG